MSWRAPGEGGREGRREEEDGEKSQSLSIQLHDDDAPVAKKGGREGGREGGRNGTYLKPLLLLDLAWGQCLESLSAFGLLFLGLADVFVQGGRLGFLGLDAAL